MNKQNTLGGAEKGREKNPVRPEVMGSGRRVDTKKRSNSVGWSNIKKKTKSEQYKIEDQNIHN